MKSRNKAGLFEVYAARVWNMLNEGKSFFIIFNLAIILLMTLINFYPLSKVLLSLAIILPLWVIFYYFDFPLKYRYWLWLLLFVNVGLFRYYNFLAISLIIIIYFAFTIGWWGTIYYHLRMGTSLLNFTRFWKLVLENSDSTSGNFMEQMPKSLIVVTMNLIILEQGINISGYVFFVVLALILGLLSNYFFFKKVIKFETGEKTKKINIKKRIAKRVYVIVIDGCRRDKLLEANSKNIKKMLEEGTEATAMRTVYPSRTVVCFSSMFTGASQKKHGVRSNLVLGSLLGKEELKTESVFDVLEEKGMKSKIISIAHLKDVFGETVETYSAIHDNETVDAFAMEKMKKLIEKEDPVLVVTQLISPDQTGHARGTSYPEYERMIEKVDKLIGNFIAWLKRKKKLNDSTIIIMADHGQSYRGIGGHGHWDLGEKYVPFIMYGKGIEKGKRIEKETRILDLAPTVSYLLGIRPPKDSIGETLI